MMMTTPRHVFTQEAALLLPANLLGGKAANLAWMTLEGMPVPRWWIVTTEAFTALLHGNGLAAYIDAELAAPGIATDGALLDKAAARIQQRVLACPVPQGLSAELQELLQGRETAPLAVRSSVVGEDAQGASFAGQMDSFLFQTGLAAVQASLLAVAASAFNARALRYRLHRGLPLTDIRCAIIIQEMIDADVAGVMFTAHPATGSRRHALVSAAWGVGEGIVGGLCNTDEHTVELDGAGIETSVADKDVAVVFDQATGRGTHEVAVSEERRFARCLSDTQVLALRDLGLQLAKLRCAPQDVEWALKDGRLYLLQTRPVTRLPAPTQPVGRRLVFDNSNIQESYCGVTTPLTFTFANRAYATVYEQTMRVIGVSEKAVQAHRDMLDNMLGLVRGRVYYNINSWYRGLLLLPSFKTNKADLERMMGLTDPVDLVQTPARGWREKLAKTGQVLRALYLLTRGFRNMDKLVAEFKRMFEAAYASLPRQTLHTLTPGELIEQARRLDREVLQRWTSPIVNDFYVMMMNGRVHRALLAAGVDNPAVVQNNLMSGEEGIESTEPTKLLLRLCGQLRRTPNLRALVEQGDNAHLLSQVQVVDADFHAGCMDYIERYGDRTMGELKLESITLRQDPSFLFAVLKNYLRRDDLTLENLSSKESQFRGQAETEAYGAVQRTQGGRALRRFKRDVARLRDAVRHRENMRLARTRLFGLYRDIFLEVGRQFTFHGLLDSPRDVFYLTLDELYAWADGRAVQTKLKPLVASRQEEYAGYEQEDLPHHFWTWGLVYLHNDFAYPHAVPERVEGADLRGTGCYPGIVEERVRLIFSPQDELSLDGQILCTVRTDPGWAPLFPTASGLLVERGSTLSHSAVVARELGIPAIVGIPDITRQLQSGQRVRMNGATGSIERLADADADVAADAAANVGAEAAT